MRQQAVRMILKAVTVVALVLGIPGLVFGSAMMWTNEQARLDTRVQSLLRAVDRRKFENTEVSDALVATLASPLVKDDEPVWIRFSVGDGESHVIGEPISGPKLKSVSSSSLRTTVRMEMSAVPAIMKVIKVSLFFLSGILASMLLGSILAKRFARRLSSPLIYLAAQAEQIGSGQVRARVRPSGIEEIDLVQDELVRTGERMAGQLAAERQFVADASHQLRTPLTALSMRLEEIDLIATDDEVRTEAQSCLEQVDRLTSVVEEFLSAGVRDGGQTEAIDLLEAFAGLNEEWEDQFVRVGRELVFTDEAEMPALAELAKVNQILATLIENSLHYGAGTTRVSARPSTNKRGVIIEVSDEGQGIDEDLAPNVFEYGISGHNSTGIGLALAKDLAKGMGGRLELTQLAPPIFTLSLAAIPASLSPDRVMPKGPVVSMGRRSRRF